MLASGCTLRSDPVDDEAGADAGSAGDAAVGGSSDGSPVVGLLSASVSDPQLGFGGTVDLSAEGASSWAHWALNGDLEAYNQRTGAAPPISDFVQIGEAALQATNCCIETGFTWTDGTPTAAATDAIGGLYVDTANASGDGFHFTVPADTTTRTLRVYTGNWCVRAKLEATLSDDSAPALVDTSFDVPNGALLNAIYTIEFRAASSGQELAIDFTIAENHCVTEDVGELHLFAAAL
jgi:hypothetical protein